MEHFFPRIQVDTYALMHTRVKLLGGCRCRPYSNYWGGYSQIIGGIYSPVPPGVGTPNSIDQLFSNAAKYLVAAGVILKSLYPSCARDVRCI